MARETTLAEFARMTETHALKCGVEMCATSKKRKADGRHVGTEETWEKYRRNEVGQRLRVFDSAHPRHNWLCRAHAAALVNQPTPTARQPSTTAGVGVDCSTNPALPDVATQERVYAEPAAAPSLAALSAPASMGQPQPAAQPVTLAPTPYTVEELRNQAICGDALLELPRFPTGCIDLIVVSPPYNMGKRSVVDGKSGKRLYPEPRLQDPPMVPAQFLAKWLPAFEQASRVMVRGGVMVVLLSYGQTYGPCLMLEYFVGIAKAHNLRMIDFGPWDKLSSQCCNGVMYLRRRCESWAYYVHADVPQTPSDHSHINKSRGANGSWKSAGLVDGGMVNRVAAALESVPGLADDAEDLIQIPQERKRRKTGGSEAKEDAASEAALQFGARFPEAVVEHFLKIFAPPRAHVLDFCGGTGTTAAVAKRRGLTYTTIELHRATHDFAVQRLAQVEQPASTLSLA